MKNFPVLYGYDKEMDKIKKETGFTSVPWDFIAPHEEQAQRNHDQSLERLAERGGLHPIEMWAVVEDQPYRNYLHRDVRQAISVLQKMVAEHISKQEGS